MDSSEIQLDKIFQFAHSLIEGKILLSGLKSSSDDWIAVEDLTLAIEYATSQNPSIPADVWLDLRETQTGGLPFVKGLYQAWESGVGNSVYAYLTELGADETLINDIDGDLYNICLMDYFVPEHIFWHKLRNAYLAGGWPCGWIGPGYPDGKLAVFDPASQYTSASIR